MDPARVALIVAIADYRDPKLQRLRAPAADAEALARVLSDPSIGGFGVELALDEDEATLSRRLARFFSNRRPDDLLLVHFSCHGIKDASGELYMAAADTETDLLSATGIPARWFNEQIGQCRSKRIVVLLDCCFSGSFPFGVHTRAGEQVNVQQHLHGRGRVVITASNAMEYSFEGDELSGGGQPSVFTAAVVEGLETGKADRDGDAMVSVDELYEYVYDRVREMTPNQNPTKLSSLEGPLYVARSSYERPVEPAALPQEIVDLAQHPYAEARLSGIEGLSRLLGSKNRGIALSARLELARMINDDSRKVSERANEVLLHHPASSEPVVHAPDAAPNEESVQAPRGAPESERKPEPEPLASSKPAPRGDAEPTEELGRANQGELALQPLPGVTPEPRSAAHHDADPIGGEPGEVGVRAVATPARPEAMEQTRPEAPAERGSGSDERGRQTGTVPVTANEGNRSGWSRDLTASGTSARLGATRARQTPARAASAVAVSGAVVVMASLPAAVSPRQTSVVYVVPVALMSVGVILLIGYALSSDRNALLLAATGLALGVLGVTFPLDWRGANGSRFPDSLGFWAGACGAAVAAVGAARASWLAFAETSPTKRVESGSTRSRATRILLVMTGPLIVIASLFVLSEWSLASNTKSIWQNWPGVIHRYPSAMILFCAFVVALAAVGIRSNRRRLLVMAAAVACLVLGEAVPLIFYKFYAPWGPGRWVIIVGAVVGVAGSTWAAATTGNAMAPGAGARAAR